METCGNLQQLWFNRKKIKMHVSVSALLQGEKELCEALESIGDGAGEFACSGLLPELGYPGLHIQNVGYVSLPVQAEQAQKIIEVAKKAPYGLGSQTLIDETVRKTWQLDPDQISIKNETFLACVKNVVATVKKQLGCDNKAVEVNLYKLLIYEMGGHFKPHRDTQKENGMFATMIIQLPSYFEGGKLTIRHAGKEKVVDFDGEDSLFCCKYAALYCDCEHEVAEIKSGCRVALVYSLCWSETNDPPSAEAGVTVIQNIARLLEEVFEDEDRRLLLWFLSHKYTVYGLSRSGINALKGDDESIVRAMLLANERLPEGQRLEFHIVEVTREIERYGYFDEYGSGEFEVDDVDADEEGVVTIKTWYKFDGSEQNIGNVPFHLENDVLNFSCPTDMTNGEYMEEFWGEAFNTEYNGPTGNAGASQTYWYKTYGIVAWPKVQSISIICKSGYEAAVKYIFDQIKQVQHLSSSNSSYQSALNDLKAVINFGISNHVSLCGSQVPTMLKALAMIHSEAPSKAASLASLFLVKVMTKKSDSSPCCLHQANVVLPLVQLTQAITWPSVSEALKTIFNMSPVSQHSRWAEFLKNVYEGSKDKDALHKDVIFTSMITCLVETFECEVRNNKLETQSADARVQHIASFLFVLGDEVFLKKFTATVCVHSYQSPKSCLLQKLIQSLEQRKLGDDQFWIKLLVRRIQQLEEFEKLGIRSFSWNQEDAVVVGHPLVEAFLKGPRQRMRYEAFTGIGHARNWAAKHFHRPALPPYSATVTVGGRGSDAYAVIEKTREWYDRKVRTIKRQLEELKKLRDFVKCQPATDNDCLPEDQLEPPAKKRAPVDLICLDED